MYSNEEGRKLMLVKNMYSTDINTVICEKLTNEKKYIFYIYIYPK